MKNLVGTVQSKKIPFMESEVTIRKLSVKDVLVVQELVKKQAKSKDTDDSQLKLLRDILRMAVTDAAEMTDADFDTFPLNDLSTLSEEIMKYSGLGDQEASGN